MWCETNLNFNDNSYTLNDSEVYMNYQVIYDDLIDRLRVKMHSMGFTPESELCEKHRVIPPSICPPKYISPWVYASPREIYVLRHLLAKIHPTIPAIVSAFRKTQDQYFATCSRDVVRSLACVLLQRILEDKQNKLTNLYEGAYDVTTSSDMTSLHTEIRALRREIYQAEDALEERAGKYTPHYGVKYTPSTHAQEDEQELFDKVIAALNPEAVTLGNDYKVK